MKQVISVRFKENGKSYYFDPAGAEIKTGDYVIVETARGIECGEVVQGVRELTDAAVPKALKPITRMADSVDVRRMRQNLHFDVSGVFEVFFDIDFVVGESGFCCCMEVEK